MNGLFEEVSVDFLTGYPVHFGIRHKEGCSCREAVFKGEIIYGGAFVCVNLVFFCNGFYAFAVFAYGVENARH